MHGSRKAVHLKDDDVASGPPRDNIPFFLKGKKCLHLHNSLSMTRVGGAKGLKRAGVFTLLV